METFNVTVCANDTLIGISTVTDLPTGARYGKTV
jgi:hypothetical protein